MLIAHIQNMDECIREDIIADIEGTDKQAEALSNGTQVAVLCVACSVDDTPEHNYYDVVFADGTTVDALSGYHLKGIEKWKGE